MPGNRLIYFVYGRDTPFLEARYSIVSAFARRGGGLEDFGVTVVTDRPDAFKGFPVEAVAVNAAELEQWRRPQGYIHRAKICVMARMLEEGADKAIFVDADTIFLSDPGKLFARVGPGRALMHRYEGRFLRGDAWDYLAKPMLAAYTQGSIPLPGRKSLPLSPDAQMWNSGIVGLAAADADACALALEINDEVYRVTKAFNAEQVGFSLALQTTTTLRGAQDVVDHYWSDIHYAGWHGGKSIRQMHHEEAQAFFERHREAGFDGMVQAFGKGPPPQYRVTWFVRGVAFVLRRIGKG